MTATQKQVASYLAKRVQKMMPSATLAITAKAKEMRAQGINVISFAAGEPDFDTPQYIKDAAIEALNQGQTKYTPASGTIELRKAICDKFKRDNGLTYTPDEIVVSCGAKHSIYNILQVLIEEGDDVLIPSPYWVSYPEMVTLAGGNPVIIPTTEATELKVNVALLNKHVTEKTKVLILNSPSNPTGAAYSRAELLEISEFVKSRKLFVISDEIYETILYDGRKHTAFAALDEETKNLTITVNGHSKAYSMTGWRMGYTASCKEISQAMSGLQSHSTSNPTSFAQAGAVKALEQGAEDTRRFQKIFEGRRDLIYKQVAQIDKLVPFKPQGAFYLFINIAATGLDSATFCQDLLEKHHVAAVPGIAFGSDQHIRISFATSEENIEEGVRRLSEFVASLG